MSKIICGAYARYSHDDGDDSESCALQIQRMLTIAGIRRNSIVTSSGFTDVRR